MTETFQFTGQNVLYRFDRLKNLIISGLNLGQVDKVDQEAVSLPPWFSLTHLTTQGGPPYDITSDAGALPQMVTDGLVLQNVRGLEIPTGLAGTSPSGLWKLGNKSLADVPRLAANLGLSMLVHKPAHSGAIVGKRMLGFFKEDGTEYFALGLSGSTWVCEAKFNGTTYVASLATGADGTPKYLRCSLTPSGSDDYKGRIVGYSLPANAFNLGDPLANAGAPQSNETPTLIPHDDVRNGIGDGSQWFPHLWIVNYDAGDDPVAFAYVDR